MPARIAVVVPCFNDGELAVETVESIDEEEPVELVVVDDASTEPRTLEVLERLAAQGTTVTAHVTNRGLAEARNTGLQTTSAPYVFPLDSDDLAVAGALAAMADRLDAAPDAAVCFGDYEEFGTHELVRAVPVRLDPFRVAYTNEYPVAALFRRTALEEVGGWQTTTPGYDDWYLWMTLAERGYDCVHLGPGRITYRKRIHAGRMLSAAKRQHRSLYRRLRHAHPLLFAEIGGHRRASDLGTLRKLLYPVVYGGRPRFRVEAYLKRLLDRTGVWTLRR